MSYTRFAIFYVPPEGPLAEFGASWLGWDIVNGAEARQPELPGLHDITMTPRKYGFHGTLKPPFRLKQGHDVQDLATAISEMAETLAPACCDGLDLTPLGRFLALTPRGDMAPLRRVAQACVRDLDGFRSPASEEELARRRQAGLSPRQEALLMKWGYPYVMEEFRFHLTLSGRLPREAIPKWRDILYDRLPDLPAPFVMDSIALCGERGDGRFELIHRYNLVG